jgi:ABC-type sugar transport system permease subunit
MIMAARTTDRHPVLPAAVSRPSEQVFDLVAVTPLALVVLSLIAGPIIYSLYVSFHDWYVVRPQDVGRFVGLRNYALAILTPEFPRALAVTLSLTAGSLIALVALGLGGALLVDCAGRWRPVLYGFAIVPWAIPTVVNGLMWKWILNPYFGALNGLLVSIGLFDQYQSFLSHPTWALAAVINANVWRELPLAMILMGAGLQTVPRDLYDAARVDGAGAWSLFRTVTFPWLIPSLFVLAILETMNALRLFDIIWIMTGGGPGTSTSVIAWYAYRRAFMDFDFGQGSAISYIIVVLTAAFAVLQRKFLRQQELA